MGQTGFSRLQNDWVEIVLPAVLVLTGLVLVGGDVIGFLSLDRIQNYWPVAVIAVGLAELFSEPKRAVAVREEHARQL